MFTTYVNKMISTYHELVWALMLEADQKTIKESKEGRELFFYLCKLRRRIIAIQRLGKKIEPDIRSNIRGKRVYAFTDPIIFSN